MSLLINDSRFNCFVITTSYQCNNARVLKFTDQTIWHRKHNLLKKRQVINNWTSTKTRLSLVLAVSGECWLVWSDCSTSTVPNLGLLVNPIISTGAVVTIWGLLQQAVFSWQFCVPRMLIVVIPDHRIQAGNSHFIATKTPVLQGKLLII